MNQALIREDIGVVKLSPIRINLSNFSLIRGESFREFYFLIFQNISVGMP